MLALSKHSLKPFSLWNVKHILLHMYNITLLICKSYRTYKQWEFNDVVKVLHCKCKWKFLNCINRDRNLIYLKIFCIWVFEEKNNQLKIIIGIISGFVRNVLFLVLSTMGGVLWVQTFWNAQAHTFSYYNYLFKIKHYFCYFKYYLMVNVSIPLKWSGQINLSDQALFLSTFGEIRHVIPTTKYEGGILKVQFNRNQFDSVDEISKF